MLFPGEDPFYSAAQAFLILGGVWTQVLSILGTAHYPWRWLCPNNGTCECVVLCNRVNQNPPSWVGGPSSFHLRPLKSPFLLSLVREIMTWDRHDWPQLALKAEKITQESGPRLLLERGKLKKMLCLPRVLGKEYLTLVLWSQKNPNIFAF